MAWGRRPGARRSIDTKGHPARLPWKRDEPGGHTVKGYAGVEPATQ